MIGLADAVMSGVSDSSAALTASLRRSALESGWTRREAAGLSVVTGPDGLSVSTTPAAEAREYGSPSAPPNPAVRRWIAEMSTIEGTLLEYIDQRVKDVER